MIEVDLTTTEDNEALHPDNKKQKKNSTNELELLADVWAIYRYKPYLLIKEFIIAIVQKAFTPALDWSKSYKTCHFSLTRWLDRCLPCQFKIVYISVKDRGTTDSLSRDPQNYPCPESNLDKKFVVAAISFFDKTINCMSSRLENNCLLSRNENVLEHSRTKEAQNSFQHGCYGNQNARI